jgi:hypothetical protein
MYQGVLLYVATYRFLESTTGTNLTTLVLSSCSFLNSLISYDLTNDVRAFQTACSTGTSLSDFINGDSFDFTH